MTTNFIHTTPVLPSSNIKRDIEWYEEKIGFKCSISKNDYTVLTRDNQWIHLQWHANTEGDPLNGGSVIKSFVFDIHPIFEEMLERGIVTKNKLRFNTPWNTNEFGFYDLNKNAIFFVADSD